MTQRQSDWEFIERELVLGIRTLREVKRQGGTGGQLWHEFYAYVLLALEHARDIEQGVPAATTSAARAA